MDATSVIPFSHQQEIARYRAADPAERKRVQGAVVEAYRPRVRAFVEACVATRHRHEAEQVALIGVLVALEKYDPESRLDFWTTAVPWVEAELQRWMSRGVYLRQEVLP